MIINTPKTVALRLGVSERRIQQLIKELGIEASVRVGKSQILSEEDIRRLEARKKSRGRKAKG